jgi:hypothetical protein
MTNEGVIMKNEDIQVIDLTSNFEKLEDENKEKLLIVGKKLLSIKNLVTDKNTRMKIRSGKFENGNS